MMKHMEREVRGERGKQETIENNRALPLGPQPRADLSDMTGSWAGRLHSASSRCLVSVYCFVVVLFLMLFIFETASYYTGQLE